MKKILLVIVLTFTSASVYADDYLIANGMSWHVNELHHHNALNTGIGYSWDSKWDWAGDVQPQFGFYKNSDYDWVVYSAFTKYYARVDLGSVPVRFGSAQGVVVGYKNYPILPLVAFVASFDFKPVNVQFLGTVYTDGTDCSNDPNCNSKRSGIKPLIAVQFKFPLK